MTAREQVESLLAHDGRAPGSDAERRAARDLAGRLEGLGRMASIEPFEARPAWPLAYSLHALLAIAGSVATVSSPVLGAALVFVAVLFTFGDATGLLMLTRRLTGRRASQNVVSAEDGGKPGTLVLAAHYDAGRTGAIFARGLQERLALLGGALRRPVSPLGVFFWSMVVLLACAGARIAGLDGVVLTAIQFVPTVLLIVSVPLLVDVALSGVVPGANDNASGVATVLRLAERYGGGALEHFDVCVLLTGSQESFALGMRAFIRRRRKRLSKELTVFVNVDEVGVGAVRYTRREGPLLTTSSHRQLVQLCDEIAEDDEDAGAFGARPMVSRSPSDGYAASSAGFPAITITCRKAPGVAPDHHRVTDAPERLEDQALERAFGFCCELIERLDAGVGSELARSVSAEPAPSP